MLPLNAAALKALTSNTLARWGLALVTFGACLWIARCEGASHQHASDRLALDDSVLAVQRKDSAAFATMRDADGRSLGGMVSSLIAIQDTAHAAQHRADSLLDRLRVVPTTVGTVTIIHSAPADSGDTVRFAGIQRQGDARVYRVPQFVVDVGAAMRDALAKSVAAESQATATLAQARRLLHDDTLTIGNRDRSIATLNDKVSVLTTQAGRECRMLPFVPCPSRKVVAVTFTILGAAAGYEVAKR